MLFRAPGDSAYVEHHPWLAKLARRLMLDDLMLVNKQGDVVYSRQRN